LSGFRIEFFLLSCHFKHIVFKLAFCAGLQASRKAKLSGEASKNKPKAQDIAQWFKKSRLASQSKSDMITSKDLKRKGPHSEEKSERSNLKSLKSKRHLIRLGSSESKPFDDIQSDQTDGKDMFKVEGWVHPKASTTSSGLLSLCIDL
jgi:hypothetical protein